MRIHLPLHPHHFLPQAPYTSSQPPLIQLGGSLVILELQGSLSHEGERSNGVVGILGLDRPDKPTLHLGEHHLLHGKIVNLPKPYAVIRKVVGVAGSVTGVEVVEEDEDDEGGEDDDDEEDNGGESKEVDMRMITPKRLKLDTSKNKGKGRRMDEEDDDEESALFAPTTNTDMTPRAGMRSSSPFYPSSAMGDYSSELDMSSPGRGGESDEEGEDEDDEDEAVRVEAEKLRAEKRIEEEKRETAKRKRKEKRIKEGKGRIRHYEVVGIVRKKVVFALRPEPIVTATVLPE